MMTETMLTDEEITALAQRLWNEKREKLMTDIEYAVRQEINHRGTRIVQHLVAKEVAAALKPLLEQSRGVIEERMKKYVERFLSTFETSVRRHMENALTQMASDLVQPGLQSALWNLKADLAKAFETITVEPSKPVEAKNE